MRLVPPQAVVTTAMLTSILLQPCTQCLASNESDEALLGQVGNQLYKDGKLAGARVVYQKLIRLCPKDCVAHERLLEILVNEDKFAEAIRQGQKVVALAPDNAEAHFLLGLALERTGNHSGACSLYSRAHALCPAHVKYTIGLARAYAKIGKAPEAVRLLQAAIKTNPESIMLWERLAERSLDAAQYATAQSALLKCADLLNKQGLVHVPVKPSEFVNAGWRLLAKDCWNAEAFRTQMQLCSLLNDSVSAVLLMDLAVKRFPDRPDVFSMLKQAISFPTLANISIEEAARRTSWDSLASYADQLKHDAEFRALATSSKPERCKIAAN